MMISFTLQAAHARLPIRGGTGGTVDAISRISDIQNTTQGANNVLIAAIGLAKLAAELKTIVEQADV